MKHMNLNQTETLSDAAQKLSLPVTTVGLNLFGISLPDIVQILTGLYLLFLVTDKVYTLYLKYKHRNNPIERRKNEQSE